MRLLLFLAGVVCVFVSSLSAQPPQVLKHEENSMGAILSGNCRQAISEATKGLTIALKLKVPVVKLEGLHSKRGDCRFKVGDYTGAAADYKVVIEVWKALAFSREPAHWSDKAFAHNRMLNGYEVLASAYLESGEPALAMTAYDEIIRYQPVRLIELWQRRIGLYVTGDYQEALRNVQAYIDVFGPVDNMGLLHFLCLARLTGLKNAEASIIPLKSPKEKLDIEQELHEVYRGHKDVETVIAGLKAAATDDSELRAKLSVAYFYAGLYHEVKGDLLKAKAQMEAAVASSTDDTDVTRIFGKLWLRRGQVNPRAVVPNSGRPEITCVASDTKALPDRARSIRVKAHTSKDGNIVELAGLALPPDSIASPPLPRNGKEVDSVLSWTSNTPGAEVVIFSARDMEGSQSFCATVFGGARR